MISLNMVISGTLVTSGDMNKVISRGLVTSGDMNKVISGGLVTRLSSRVLFLTREGRDGGMIQGIVMVWHGSLSRCFIYLKELTQFIFIGIPEERC